MALYSGVTGKISIMRPGSEPRELVYANTFSVSISRNIREVLRFGKDTKEKRPGIKDWSASASGMADFSPDGGQRELRQAYDEGALVQATFYLADGVYIQGEALIESLEVGLEADGDATMDISLAGSGDAEFIYSGDETTGPDTIGSLTVLSVAGLATGDTTISVTEEKDLDNFYVYQIGTSQVLVSLNQILSTWDLLPVDGKLTGAVTGQRITVSEVDSNNRAKKAGYTTIVAGE